MPQETETAQERSLAQIEASDKHLPQMLVASQIDSDLAESLSGSDAFGISPSYDLTTAQVSA